MAPTAVRGLLANFTAISMTRFLIASYFIALSLGLISGVDISRLATPFLAEPLAGYLMSGTVLGLTLAILTGFQRRATVMLLSLIVFWASYVTILSAPPGGEDIGAFWRDIALIGGLLAAFGTVAKREEPAPAKASPEAANEEDAPTKTVSRMFREDFEVVRML